MMILINEWLIKQIGKIKKHDLDRRFLHNANDTLIELGDESCWDEIVLLYANSVYSVNELWIAIYLDQPNFSPTVVPQNDDNTLLLYFSNRLAVINLHEKALSFEYLSNSIIYTVKDFNNTIVVVSELSVNQLKKNGDVLVNYFLDDVLESFEFKEKSIVCKTMSSSTEYLLCTE